MISTKWRAAWQMPGGLPQAADETWAYLVDDSEVTYGQGWWPFYATKAGHTEPQPSIVRLAPDIAFHAWFTEYVIVGPDDEGFATGGCNIVGRDNPGVVKRAAFQLRLTAAGWEPLVPSTQPCDLEVLAEKIKRVCAALNTANTERDSGIPLRTAAARQEAREAQHAGN